MIRHGMLYVAGAIAATAIGFSHAALADGELHPPGTIGPLEFAPVFTTNIDASPFFRYTEQTNVYNVLDGDDVLGQFTEDRSYFSTPYPLFGSTNYSVDLVTDSSFPRLEEGATYQSFSSGMFTLQGYMVPFSSDYLNNPGIATSYYLTLLGTRFPIWDITYDTAGDAATESGGLDGLFGFALGDLGDWFGADASGLGDLLDPDGVLGIDPGGLADLFGFDPAALTDFGGLF